MTAWPGSLPQPSAYNYEQTLVDPALRTPMEHGPAKVRRLFTYVPRLVSMQFVMTQAQVNTLRTFYNTTIQGIGDVDWTDDLTQATAVYRFVGPPVYTYTDGGLWQVGIVFEVRSETG